MVPTNKNEFFEKFGKNILKNNYPSALKTFKPFLWVAWIIGVFPVQVSCIWWQGVTLHVKKISLAYLYSFCLLLYKIMTTVQFGDFLARFNPGEPEILTDFIAGILGFLFGFCFGNFAHVLAIWKLPSFLKSVHSIEDFDKKYAIRDGDCPFVNKPVKGRIIMKLIISCLVVIYTPLTMIWHVITTKDTSEFKMLPGFYTRNCSFIIAYMALGFLAMEFGTGFLYIQLFSIKNLLIDRLNGIVKMVQEKNKKVKCTKNIDATDFAPNEEWSAVSPPNPFAQKTWQAIACQYEDFLDIFTKYQDFAGPYFTILYSTLIIASVCIIYPQINSDKSLTITFGPALKISTALTLVRIIALAATGETFKATFKKLVKALMISSVQGHVEKPNIEETKFFKGILKEVTTSKLALSANGFFTVSRKNVTSIVSVIITYIIVLLQFSSADKKKDFTSGVSTNYGFGAPGNYSDFGYNLSFPHNQSYQEPSI